MNKTLTIGLAGFSFVIDEHAYIKLADYLAALRRTLDPVEADEVMHDIEIRMVEIFKELLNKREVINVEDVEQVIAQIGTPEQIDAEENPYYSETMTAEKPAGDNRTRQLFRDPAHAKIAGVCAGLAAYFGMSVGTMRLLWVGLFIFLWIAPGSSFSLVVLYIVLWIALPKATTASDYLKMQGKPINFDTLKDQSSSVLKFANDSSERVGRLYQNNKGDLSRAGNSALNVLRYILGVFFALMALAALVGVLVIFGLFSNPNMIPMGDFNFYLGTDYNGTVFTTLMLLTLLIPGVIFTLLSIRLLSPKTKLKNTGYIVGGLILVWLGLAVYFGVSVARMNMMYTGDKEETENIAIPATSDTLSVERYQVQIPQNFTAYSNSVFSDGTTVYKGDRPYVKINRKDGNFRPYVNVYKEANGYNQPLRLDVPVKINGNRISFPNFIRYPHKFRFRRYDVNYEVVVPKHYVILEDGKLSIDDEQATTGADYDEEGDNNDDFAVGTEQDSIIVNNRKVAIKDIESSKGKKLKIEKDDVEEVNVNIGENGARVKIKTK